MLLLGPHRRRGFADLLDGLALVVRLTLAPQCRVALKKQRPGCWPGPLQVTLLQDYLNVYLAPTVK